MHTVPPLSSAKPLVRAQPALASRTERAFEGLFSYKEAMMEGFANRYEPDSNPDGLVSMCVAENRLNFDFVKEKLKGLGELPVEVTSYTASNGLPRLTSALAAFLSHYIVKTPVLADHLCVTPGCTGALDLLFWCLANPGEAVIVPAPTYPAFRSDLYLRDSVHLVYTQATEDHTLTEAVLDEAFARGGGADKVRALLLTNPNNPTGQLHSRQDLAMIVRWCADHDLHLVADEIYALSIFGEGEPFVSTGEVGDMSKGSIHILWGVSKDFGLNGFRLGCIYTQHKKLLQALMSLNNLSTVSNQTQNTVAYLLENREWTDRCLANNAACLALNWATLTQGLDRLKIPYHTTHAAQFCWVDMRKFIGSGGADAERQLFETMWREAKVILTPGKDCIAPEPGFFRICFAAVSEQAIKVALQRLENHIAAITLA